MPLFCDDIHMTNNLIQTLGKRAQDCAQNLALATTLEKNRALLSIAHAIFDAQEAILAANAKDLSNAQHLSPAMQDRLTLDKTRLAKMVEGVKKIIELPDPVGEISQMKTNEKGLQIGRMRVPLGVIGIIYESRPNVTLDAAALCLKSGNACILRGGSEAVHTNTAIVNAIWQGLKEADFFIDCVQFVDDTDRAHVNDMLHAQGLIDVLIPRGGKTLVSLISQEAKVPVIKHLDGICHVYIDKDADLEKAWRVADNAKTYRAGICGAMETLLVHKDIAHAFLPKMAEIFRNKQVELRGCAQTLAIVPDMLPACDEDWQSEYLDLILSIRVVDSYAQAVAHIQQFSSKHTDSIVTENITSAQNFLRSIDSASVMVNTPTCFADGYEYGLGAEIGISTDKIHWRGPVGLEGLTSQKFILISDGVLRS